MGAYDPLSKLVTVTDKAAVIVGGLGPVRALHLLDIEAIDATRVAQDAFANGLAVS